MSEGRKENCLEQLYASHTKFLLTGSCGRAEDIEHDFSSSAAVMYGRGFGNVYPGLPFSASLQVGLSSINWARLAAALTAKGPAESFDNVNGRFRTNNVAV